MSLHFYLLQETIIEIPIYRWVSTLSTFNSPVVLVKQPWNLSKRWLNHKAEHQWVLGRIWSDAAMDFLLGS